MLLQGIVSGGHVACALGVLPLAVELPEGAAEVLVRPEQIRLLPDPAAGVLRGRVQDVTFYGHDASVTLALGQGQDPGATITARVSGHMAPQLGEEVGVGVEGPAMAYPHG
ncbi:MAG: TOBE domain-containing protein [Acetobacteraceae bacterium]